MEEFLELHGFITFYKYQNEQTNYRIALFKIDDNLQERVITIVGYFPKFNKDERLTVNGFFSKHEKYGLQFNVTNIIKDLPTSEEMVVRFLSSSKFKKVGKSTAKKIYDLLKEETISTLINDEAIYEQLISLKIITDKQKDSLIFGLKDFTYNSDIVQLLINYGLSLKNIMKIESVYKDRIDDILKINPYQIVIDIDGIGFKTIDKMALNMGIDIKDKRRVKAAILYCISFGCHSRGDTYLFINDIQRYINQLIKIDTDLFNECLNDLINEKYVIVDDEKYYHYSLYYAEETIAHKLKPLIKRKIDVDFLPYIDNIIAEIENESGIKYTDEQIQTLKEALQHGLVIITGGPGTGKTTILDALLKIYKKGYNQDINISLCAPTGRASKRMSILTNTYACTVHRLLKWDLHSNTFSINEENPIYVDVLIIDEFSMVDTLLFSALLKGVVNVSQIILIGDDGQIPSVGAGNLLYDLLQIEKVKSLKLNKIFRQAAGSSIISLAHDIRYNNLTENYVFGDDVRFYNITSIQAPKQIVKIISVALAQGYDMDDIQVIVPMYANVAGIDNINSTIQDFINPYEEDKEQISVGHQIFRLHDRVLQLKNQPEDDIFNGDIGYIIDIDLDDEKVFVDFEGNVVEYSKQLLTNLTLAYAISVHKSQGSEFKTVLMCVFKEYGHMLNKKLIYTAVSRAKQNLIILGNYQTFMYKSVLEEKRTRNTSLVNRIEEIL